MNAILSIQDAYDQDQGIFSVLIKKEVRGSGLLFLEKRRKVFGGAIGLKRPVNTKEDDVVTKASAHVREKTRSQCIITDRLDNDHYRKHAIVKEVNK